MRKTKFGQTLAHRIGSNTDAVEGRYGIGGCVPHPRTAVQHHHSVADARGHARVGNPSLEREQSGGDHVGEVIEDRQIRALQLSGATTGHRRHFARQYGYCSTLAHDGNRGHVHRIVQVRQGDLTLLNLPALGCRGNERAIGVVGELADEIRLVQGLAGGRTHLRCGEPVDSTGGCYRHVQQQIGEGKVGQHPPLGNQCGEMRNIVLRQLGVFACKLEERRHGRPPFLPLTVRCAAPRRGRATTSRR